MRSLFQCWEEVAGRLRAARTVALFLDFDGTLAPFCVRPEGARLPPATRRALRRLTRRPSLRVCVISGRRRADLSKRIAVPGVRYLGLLGNESGSSPVRSGSTDAAVAQGRTAVAARLAGVPGVSVEDKGAMFAVHYRAAPPAAIGEARAALRAALEPLNGRLRLLPGDHVWEVAPRGFGGKGSAARRNWRTFSTRALPVYIGNDGTDEPAFDALAQGLTVRVGPAGPSRARFRLANPAEVCRFLERLERELR
jgi:trehalose-phosphatase